jgi:flagellar biosynthesis anti-sigma factor FlgM
MDRTCRRAHGGDDMDVRGLTGIAGTSPIRSVGAADTAREPQRLAKPPAQADQVEISSAGMMLDQLSQQPDLRAERLNQIKAAIADGTYDTDEKLEAALSRMFDTLGIDLDA